MWVGFHVACFLYKIKSQTTKNYLLLWEKSGPNATFNLIFLWVGWPRVGEFHENIYMFSNPTEKLGKSQAPSHLHEISPKTPSW